MCFCLMILCGCSTNVTVSQSSNEFTNNTIEITENTHDRNESEYEFIEKMAENDIRYKWVKAFIDKNSETCANMVQNLPQEYWTERNELYFEWYKKIESLEFGEYSVEEINEDSSIKTLSFKFEIVKSELDTIPVGTYLYHITEGVIASVHWEKIEPNDSVSSIENSSDIVTILTLLTPQIQSFNANDYTVTENKQIDSGIYYVLDYCYKNWLGVDYGMTRENIEVGAKQMFGISNYIPPSDITNFNNGVYTSNYLPSYSVAHDILSIEENDGEYSCYVQFYSDPMKIVKSCKVRYVFEKNNSEYRYTVKSIETVDSGMYSPLVWVN